VTSRGRRRASLYVKNGQIFGVSTEILPAATRVEAGGLLLLPGLVDTHVHLMEPAESEREIGLTGRPPLRQVESPRSSSTLMPPQYVMPTTSMTSGPTFRRGRWSTLV
jgi:imidazolonepropionase-like amidohydrolase